MRMTVKEFCVENKCDISGIYKKIKRKEKELSGHIWKKNGSYVLDEEAQELLKPKFERGLSHRVTELEKENVELKEQNADIVLESRQVENYINSLESKIDKLESEKVNLIKEIEEWKMRSEKSERELVELKEQNEKLLREI